MDKYNLCVQIRFRHSHSQSKTFSYKFKAATPMAGSVVIFYLDFLNGCSISDMYRWRVGKLISYQGQHLIANFK